MLSPFLIWNAAEFFRVTIFSLVPFESAQFWGRFTLVPLISQVHPHAPWFLFFATILCTMLVSARCRTYQGFLAVSGLGLFVLLALLHRTFSHYYLPAIALVLMSSATAEFRKRPAASVSSS